MHPTYPVEEWKKTEGPADHSWVEQWLLKSCGGGCGDICAVHMHMHSKQVVKVIWHKAASSLQTGDSIVFTRLCQCALMGGHIGTIWWIRLNHPSVLCNGMPISASKLPLRMGESGPSSNTWFPGPTRVLDTNGISIGSAISAGLTSVTDRPCYSVGNNRPHLHTWYYDMA